MILYNFSRVELAYSSTQFIYEKLLIGSAKLKAVWCPRYELSSCVYLRLDNTYSYVRVIRDQN